MKEFVGAFARWLVTGLTALSLGACSTLVTTPSRGLATVTPPALAHAQAGFARVLARHVNQLGEVEFAALRDDDGDAGIHALERYVDAIALAPVDPDDARSWWPTPQARLAHLINAYNALSMYNVISLGIPASHDGWRKVKFFVLRKFEIGGQALSLYDFENDVIRQLDEPRIHFALNCSAVSCPVLPRTLFTGDGLDAQLEREAREFFARRENFFVDDTRRQVRISELLKFYLEDFVPRHAPSLLAYAARYAPVSVPPGYEVVFIPYDWTIANASRPARQNGRP